MTYDEWKTTEPQEVITPCEECEERYPSTGDGRVCESCIDASPVYESLGVYSMSLIACDKCHTLIHPSEAHYPHSDLCCMEDDGYCDCDRITCEDCCTKCCNKPNDFWRIKSA